MNHIFDAKYAKKQAKNYNIKVTLKKNFKGTSLYAKNPIKKGSIIAFYKFLVHKYDDDFSGQKNDMYAMSIYTKKDRFNPRLIGDIYEGSLQPPKNNITFWAYFSNEPSGKQDENAMLDIDLKGNYKNRSRVKAGDTMIYRLIATRNIKSGEEICWCYGGAYGRDYDANCDE